MSEQKKPKILVFSDYYLPGYKSGGGMRTIVNMVERLHTKYDFWIVTRDHDGKQDKTQYKNVRINNWNDVKEAKVFYLSKDNIKISKVRELILDVNPNSIYTNSYFATLSIFVMVLRKFKKIPNIKIVVANCGELSEGSLKLKPLKKNLFINFSKRTGLHRNIIWKASSQLEKEEIERVKGKGGEIFIAPDLPERVMNENFSLDKKPLKNQGEAKLIFLSRFTRKKNFKWLLENLSGIKGNLLIDIFAPIEDEGYWIECKELIQNLPENISVIYRGSISHDQVGKKLLEHHFFILPTLSENFGHVFLEAMSSGCPLITSDRTPWLKLEKKGVGWDLPLENPGKWREVLNHCIEMNDEEFKIASSNARGFAENWLLDEKIEKDTIKILEYSLIK